MRSAPLGTPRTASCRRTQIHTHTPGSRSSTASCLAASSFHRASPIKNYQLHYPYAYHRVFGWRDQIHIVLTHIDTPKDAKRSTPTQQPPTPWSSLLRQRPRQCLTLQLTHQGWRNYQKLSCSVSTCTYLGLVARLLRASQPRVSTARRRSKNYVLRHAYAYPVESRIGPKRGFAITPGTLLPLQVKRPVTPTGEVPQS